MSIIVSMSLDFAECDQARLARDPSYDGRFYTGVHTTGIYCRPVCRCAPPGPPMFRSSRRLRRPKRRVSVPACGAGLRPLRSATHGSAAGRQLKERCGYRRGRRARWGRGLPSNASLCASV